MTDYKEKYEMIKSARRYIEVNLQNDMDLEALARRYACSYSAFRKIFLEIGGFTPHQYIRLRCIQRAAQLLREGRSVTETAQEVGFLTTAGFYKAFHSIMGIGPQEFAASRGMALMTPPTLVEKPDFSIVGYVLEPEEGTGAPTRHAYWLIRSFPDVSAEEYYRIGGGTDSAAAWFDGPEGSFYLLGPPVQTVRYVPEPMRARAVPGGRFLEFPVPETKNILLLYENVVVTWYYAREQWLPASEWEEDTDRIAFEYYSEAGNSVLIPVRPRRCGA